MKRTPLKRKSPMKSKGFTSKNEPKPRPTFEEMIAEKSVKWGSELSAPKDGRKPLRKRSPKQEGWIHVAREILDERGPTCEVCGKHIYSPGPINFSHLLPRSTYPDYKRDKRNIRIKDAGCHTLWHEHGPKVLQYSTSWMAICALYFELHAEANNRDSKPDQ